MNFLKKTLKILLTLSALGLISIILSNMIIKGTTKNFVFDDVKALPACKTGVLLGCSKKLQNGRYNNLYFFYRIDATVALFQSGKIQNIIISGDNSRKDYSEPEDMQAELIKRGIPQDKIYLDFAGFRTLDSVVRAKEIFGQEEYIIISQRFHNERAVYLARKNGIEAFGYNAKDVDKYFGFKTQLREYFARVKVFVDLVLGVDPKFGGEKIVIK